MASGGLRAGGAAMSWMVACIMTNVGTVTEEGSSVCST